MPYDDKHDELLRRAQNIQEDSESWIRHLQERLEETKVVELDLSQHLPYIWPRRVISSPLRSSLAQATFNWLRGVNLFFLKQRILRTERWLKKWEGYPKIWIREFQSNVRRDLNNNHSDFKAETERFYSKSRRNLELGKSKLQAEISKLEEQWDIREKKRQTYANFLAEFHTSGKWLIGDNKKECKSLFEIDRCRPTGFRLLLPLVIQNTPYDLGSWRQIKRAHKAYKSLLKHQPSVDNLIPPAYLHFIHLEFLKLEFYFALLYPSGALWIRPRLVEISDEAHQVYQRMDRVLRDQPNKKVDIRWAEDLIHEMRRISAKYRTR